MSVKTKQAPRLRRRRRVRAKVRGSAERPRLSVFRSNRGMVAQLIDDSARPHSGRRHLDGVRAARAAPMEQAAKAGRAARRAAPRSAGVEACVFDRGGYRFHGRVKALAEGAREGGPRSF